MTPSYPPSLVLMPTLALCNPDPGKQQLYMWKSTVLRWTSCDTENLKEVIRWSLSQWLGIVHRVGTLWVGLLYRDPNSAREKADGEPNHLVQRWRSYCLHNLYRCKSEKRLSVRNVPVCMMWPMVVLYLQILIFSDPNLAPQDANGKTDTSKGLHTPCRVMQYLCWAVDRF